MLFSNPAPSKIVSGVVQPAAQTFGGSKIENGVIQ
jgi:hypothetical protein